MAMNVNDVNQLARDAIAEAMSDAYDQPKAEYVEYAGIMADSIVSVVVQYILDNAETDPSGESII